MRGKGSPLAAVMAVYAAEPQRGDVKAVRCENDATRYESFKLGDRRFCGAARICCTRFKVTHGRKRLAKSLTYSDNSGRRRPLAAPNRCFAPGP